jgi:hypothetical protein
MTPELEDHPLVPDSKPGFATFWAGVQGLAAVTVSVNKAAWVADEPVPVIVTVYTPAAVALEVEIVSVDDPPAVTEVGENEAVAPLGRPLAVSETVCAEPDATAVETVALVPAPAATDASVGLSESEKSFVAAAVTLSVSVAVCVPVEPVPVIVTL